MSNYKGKIHIVYDGMWGSCGKGKFCGTFARDGSLNISVCVNNNAPNAGHTFVFDDGRKVITRHIPIGFVNKNIPYLVIGESAVIDIDVFKKEIEQYKDLLNGRKIYICDTAAVVQEKHKQTEREMLKTGSTFKGSGAALVDKIMRQQGNIVKNNEELQRMQEQGLIKIVESKTFFPLIYNGLAGFLGTENILVECSQGDALGINGANYPYTTSRDCGPSQAIKDIHATDYKENIIKYCVFRPYPIRINNQSETGYNYTGDFQGAKEIDWGTVAKRSGMSEEELKQMEQTTVTKRLRRVAEFSIKQFQEMLLDTKPDVCLLNFAEQIDANLHHLDSLEAEGIIDVYNDALYYGYGEELENENYYDSREEFTISHLAEMTDEDFEFLENQHWALGRLVGYIEQIEDYFNELFNGKIKMEIGQIGTGAKEGEVIDRESIITMSENLSAKYARQADNPFDYADKSNKNNFDDPV